jgi:hypothetical protein
MLCCSVAVSVSWPAPTASVFVSLSKFRVARCPMTEKLDANNLISISFIKQLLNINYCNQDDLSGPRF